MMAKTGTRTWTATIARTEILVLQINYIVKSTTTPGNFEEVIDIGVVKNQWIEVIGVRAVDDQGNIYLEIIMRIDWERHKLHIETGSESLPFDKSLPADQSLSVAIIEIVKFFNKKVKEMGLKTNWYTQYHEGVDRKQANKLLGLVESSDRKWAIGEKVHVLGDISELTDELSIDLELVIPEGVPDERIIKKRGIVKWFSATKGYGFIVSEDFNRDIFVHYSQILEDGFRSLTAGQVVEFEVEKGPKGLRAVSVEVIKSGSVE